MPTPEQLLNAIEHDHTALAAAARKGLDAAIPTCPGWTVKDLLVHLGRIHRQKDHVLRLNVTDREFVFVPPEDEFVDWFVRGARMMLQAFAGRQPSESSWTWFPADQTVGFWLRRMAHETLIHRVDAELAFGETTEVDPVVAADGIDEALNVFLTRIPAWATVERGDRTIRLVTPGHSWTLRTASYSGTTRSGREIRPTPTVIVEEEHKSPDCQISGDPAALDLWLWGRRPLDDLTLEGDARLAEYLRDVAAKST